MILLTIRPPLCYLGHDKDLRAKGLCCSQHQGPSFLGNTGHQRSLQGREDGRRWTSFLASHGSLPESLSQSVLPGIKPDTWVVWHQLSLNIKHKSFADLEIWKKKCQSVGFQVFKNRGSICTLIKWMLEGLYVKGSPRTTVHSCSHLLLCLYHGHTTTSQGTQYWSSKPPL